MKLCVGLGPFLASKKRLEYRLELFLRVGLLVLRHEPGAEVGKLIVKGREMIRRHMKALTARKQIPTIDQDNVE